MRELKRVPQLLHELKADKVEVVVLMGYTSALAAKATDIPTVVAFGAGDPVATGWSMDQRGLAAHLRYIGRGDDKRKYATR